MNTLNTLSQELQNQLRKLLESKEANITESAKEEILNILDQNKQQRIQIMQELELNI
ncbi:MAG: hypothetical protein LBG59_04220 [Candidatus Peribacteria bacterium]|nr:hypothetical protein [Candidatus Peribacteria bacterium]